MFDVFKNFFKKKSAVKKYKRLFASGQINRLTSDWLTAGSLGIDEILRWQLDTIRNRAIDSYKNNPYIRAYIKRMQINIVGDNGIVLQNKAITNRNRPNTEVNRLIEDAWNRFCTKDNFTIYKNINFIDFSNLVLRLRYIEGEAFINIIRGKEAQNEFDYTLQLLDNSQININKNGVLKNGNVVSLGVEKDKYGRIVAYHILTQDREEKTLDANNVIHVYKKEFVNQSRGIPEVQDILIYLRMLSAYEEACLVAKRVAASKMGFIIMPDNEQYGIEDTVNNEITTEVSAGMLEQLPAGADFKAFDPAEPKEDFANFKKSVLMSIASSLGVSYNALTNDYENVNFSSLRSSFLNERDYFKSEQRWLIDNFIDILFKDFISWCMLTGKINLPISKFDDYVVPTWIPKRWDWVDPLKDINAKVVAINNNMTSLHRVLAEMGLDYDEIINEIKQEKQDILNIGGANTNANNNS